MRPGRNEACPCGSGRKYKKCCLTTSESTPESNIDALRRAIPVDVIQAAIAEADDWSPEEYDRVAHEFFTKHPLLASIVASSLENATEALHARASFSFVVMIRIFERHYGSDCAPISLRDVEATLSSNVTLVRNTHLGNLRKNPANIMQPFVLMFISDTVFDYVTGEIPECDWPALTATFKTAVDLLDQAYAIRGQAPRTPNFSHLRNSVLRYLTPNR